MMIRQPTYIILALVFLSSSLAEAEEGRPLTAADISGKTICWDDGWRLTYAANGRYFGDRIDQPPKDHRVDDGHRWVFVEAGVIKVDSGPTKIEKYFQIAVLPDGQLQKYSFSGRSTRGTQKYWWGKVCN
jgi:hypothetical protein